MGEAGPEIQGGGWAGVGRQFSRPLGSGGEGQAGEAVRACTVSESMREYLQRRGAWIMVICQYSSRDWYNHGELNDLSSDLEEQL